MISFLRSTAVPLCLAAGALFFASCGGDDNGNPMNPSTTGTLMVTVTADGAPRSGVVVNRYATGSASVTSTATTGADGTATFANVPEGSWDVEVVPPTDFALDAGEQARKTASVVAGQTANATFALVDTFAGETITASGTAFSQPDLTIAAGTTVRWVNGDGMLHTVTPDGHTEWTSEELPSAGATFKHTFSTPGTYDYYCDPHLANGMTGTITVN